MLSYSQALSLYQKFTNNTETANTTFFDIVYNERNRNVLSSEKWPFLERQSTKTTVADQQFYNLPNLKKVINVKVTISNQVYVPTEAPDRYFWDRLNQSTATRSDTPEYFYVQNNQVGLWPIPSSAGNTITINHTLKQKDLTIADYTTGTITTATNGDETIVGSGTSWTAKMVDRWLRITDSNTANTGDGEWYQIDSITDGTNLELEAPYGGVSIAAGSGAYTLAQVSLIPEDYHLIPVYLATADFWSKEGDFNRATFYENKANLLLSDMKNMYLYKTDDPVIQESVGFKEIINPNLTKTI